jgi:type I restriction enzyme S subunit
MTYKLEDICTFINGGSWNESEYVDSGLPVIKVSNLKNSKISSDGISFISEDSYEKYKKHMLNVHDVIIATVGSHPTLETSAAGRSVIVTKSYEGYLLNQNAVCVRSKKPEILDQTFLGYLTKTQYFKNFIQNRGSGAANQMRIPIGGIKSFSLDLPPLPTQQKIAIILYNYDDLIENNLKRIKLLEESARLTYEEWFLRFRIDGKKLDIDQGTDLPFGWELVKVGSLLQRVQTTVKIKSSEILESGKNLVIDQGADFIAGYTNEANINQYTDNSFIVFGDHTRVLKFVNFSFARGADGTQILISNNSRMPQTLFYHSLLAVDLSNYHYARHFKFLKEEMIILPTESIAAKYNIKYITFFDQIQNLRNQNKFLEEARDILLPRLMTGMIDTDEMDVAV